MSIDVYKDWLGIPEGPRPPDHYSLLRLPQFEDNPERIRANYKKLNGHVRKYASGQYSSKSQALLNELAKAMLCLTDAELKKDYDRSQGRAIDDRDEETGRRPLSAYLIDDGLLTNDQAQEAKAFADKAGLSLRDALVQRKFVDADLAARAYAKELGRPFVDLNETVPDDDALDVLPRQVARRHVCIPLYIEDDCVWVACADEPAVDLEDEVRLRYSVPMHVVIATPLSINQAIAKYYAAGMRTEGQTLTKSKPAAKTAAPATDAASGDPAPAVEKAKPKRAPGAPLSPEEKKERKQLGIVLCCWIVAGLANLDWWILYPLAWKFFMPAWFPLLATLFLAPPALWVVYNMYLKD